MALIVAVHSFRGGTGKSNLTASLAVLMAQAGLRVGVVDTDIQSPGVHVIFGLDEKAVRHTLNDFLWERCDILDAAYEIHDESADGRLWLIPCSMKTGAIARVLREGYDVGRLNTGFRELIRSLALDCLLIDTHPGLNEETLLSMAISDVLVTVLRPDRQDTVGTSVAVDVARRLHVPRLCLIVNKVPRGFDRSAVGQHVAESYLCDVLAALPDCEEMLQLGSERPFPTAFPDHEFTELLRGVVEKLIPATKSTRPAT